MNFAKDSDFRIAVKVAYDTFAPLFSGVKKIERIFSPHKITYRYISGGAAKTEIIGYSETVRIAADLVLDDAACMYLYSLAEMTGRDCQTEIFLYDKEEISPGIFYGKRYPATAAVTKIASDGNDLTAFYGFETELYINGEGTPEEREVLQ